MKNENDMIIHRWSKAQTAFISAFVSLLSQEPFEAIRTIEIIKCSDYSRSAFYSSFKDKYDLSEQIFHNEVKLYVDIIYNSIHSLQTVNVNVEVFPPYIKWFEHVYKNRELYSCIIHRKAPGWNTTSFTLLAMEYYKNLFSIKYNDTEKANKISIPIMNFVSTKQQLAFIEYWELEGFKYSPEYMAKQTTIIAAGGLIEEISTQNKTT